MRRRVASAVVVAAVAAVAVAAIVDEVRPRAAPPLDARSAAALDGLGATGTLVYTDPACALHALSLPGLRPAGAPKGRAGCEISVSPDGSRVAQAGVRWSAGGKRCGGVCAWRGEERTVARGEEIVGEGRMLVSHGELLRAARTHPNAPDVRAFLVDLRVRDLVWTSARAVVVLLEARYRPGPPGFQTTVAVFRDGRLARHVPYFGVYERLAVSKTGTVLLEPAVSTQSLLFTGLGPSGPIAWSPDGRLLAVATRASVFVVDRREQRRIRIPVTARDLAWR